MRLTVWYRGVARAYAVGLRPDWYVGEGDLVFGLVLHGGGNNPEGFASAIALGDFLKGMTERPTSLMGVSLLPGNRRLVAVFPVGLSPDAEDAGSYDAGLGGNHGLLQGHDVDLFVALRDEVASQLKHAWEHLRGRPMERAVFASSVGFGYSNGANTMWRLLTERPGFLQGAALHASSAKYWVHDRDRLSGALPIERVPTLDQPPLVLVVSHGVGDDVFPFEGGVVSGDVNYLSEFGSDVGIASYVAPFDEAMAPWRSHFGDLAESMASVAGVTVTRYENENGTLREHVVLAGSHALPAEYDWMGDAWWAWSKHGIV